MSAVTSAAPPAAGLGDALAVLLALDHPDRLQLLMAAGGLLPGCPAPCTLDDVARATGRSVREVAETATRMHESGLVRVDGRVLHADTTVFARAAAAVEEAMPVTALLRRRPGVARWFRRGRLLRVPERYEQQAEVAALLVELLPTEVEMSEDEVGAVLGTVGDPAELRRLLVDHRLVERQASRGYRRT